MDDAARAYIDAVPDDIRPRFELRPADAEALTDDELSGFVRAPLGARAVSQLQEVGDADGWRCWLCDEPVDRAMSVNDARGPSLDTCITKAKAKAKSKGGAPTPERLAHRGCNTGRGATEPVVPWPTDLFVVDPAAILPSVERLERKGGREVMARCPSRADADAAADWLVERISRLRPALAVSTEVVSGGGQFVLVVRAGPR